jgi:hypothetical protein
LVKGRREEWEFPDRKRGLGKRIFPKRLEERKEERKRAIQE